MVTQTNQPRLLFRQQPPCAPTIWALFSIGSSKPSVGVVLSSIIDEIAWRHARQETLAVLGALRLFSDVLLACSSPVACSQSLNPETTGTSKTRRRRDPTPQPDPGLFLVHVAAWDGNAAPSKQESKGMRLVLVAGRDSGM